MDKLTPDQRNAVYLLEAERTGIHKSVLAALYAVHQEPILVDGEKGLGIAPANRITLEQVNSFTGQVQYAANTVRSLTDSLSTTGWKGGDLWDADRGRYAEKFLRRVADGYTPVAGNTTAAVLERSNPDALLRAYEADWMTDFRAARLAPNLAYLDGALLTLLERIPAYYLRLPYQREALVEALRIWRRLDTRQVTIESLQLSTSEDAAQPDEVALDQTLLQFVQQAVREYNGLPQQREALLRLTQLWRQLDSRESAIASLSQNTSPETHLQIIDPALIAFVQRLPQSYRSQGEQRNALVEAFRIWRQLDSRPAALVALGIDPRILSGGNTDKTALTNAAAQLDRELLTFVQRIPGAYRESEPQRDALIRLVHLWRGLETREQAIRSLLEDVRRMQQARAYTPEAAPQPVPLILPPRPNRWTPNNIQIYASILPNGSFTWAEATHGGTRMPQNQANVDAIVRMARLAQQARDRIGRPFMITCWYRPAEINATVGGVSNSRHIVGDAIDFYCEGLTGDQIYWALDPWWPGGLGRYVKYPYLSHIDARSYRARWRH